MSTEEGKPMSETGEDATEYAQPESLVSLELNHAARVASLAAAADCGRAEQLLSPVDAARIVDQKLRDQILDMSSLQTSISSPLSDLAQEALLGAIESQRTIDAQVSAAVQALRIPAVAVTELMERMEAEHRRVQAAISSAAKVALNPQGFVVDHRLKIRLDDLERVAEGLVSPRWKELLQSPNDGGLEEVLRGHVEATSRIARALEPLAAYPRDFAGREMVDADLAALRAEVERFETTLEQASKNARPQFPIGEPEFGDGEAECAQLLVNVESSMFTPVETREILTWMRASADPLSRVGLGCGCVSAHDRSMPFGIAVFRVFHYVDCGNESTSLPSIMFECEQCGRRVLQAEWDELRRAHRGLELLEGGGEGISGDSLSPALSVLEE